jgi:HAD superfamily hydrolase (TIGR01509 family)
MIKAIILDLNGIFLQSEHLSDRMEDKYGIKREEFVKSLKEVMEIARKPGNVDTFHLWEPHLRRLGVTVTKDEFFQFWFSGEHLVLELVDFVRRLREKGIRVYILSNNFIERTSYYLRHSSEIFNSVDSAYFSWETGYVKPDPQAYKHVLDSNNLKPEECIYFDDSDRNVEVAKGLGIDAQKYEGLDPMRVYVKKRLWQRAQQEVRQLADRLGRPIDHKIEDTVAILRLLEVNTIASCAGHVNRITRGPYIMFDSADNAMIHVTMKEIHDRKSIKYKKLFNNALKNNLMERQKILPYLEGFYKNRMVSYNQRIIIEGFGPSINYLMCQGADLRYALDDKRQQLILKRNQAEMRAFTEYMKAKYFNLN